MPMKGLDLVVGVSEVFSWFPGTLVFRISLPFYQIKQFFDYLIFALDPSSSNSNFARDDFLDFVFFFSFYFFGFRSDLFA